VCVCAKPVVENGYETYDQGCLCVCVTVCVHVCTFDQGCFACVRDCVFIRVCVCVCVKTEAEDGS